MHTEFRQRNPSLLTYNNTSPLYTKQAITGLDKLRQSVENEQLCLLSKYRLKP